METAILKHKFASVNGVRLHYVTQGSGDRLVVLLHGWPEFWYSWRFQIPFLAGKFKVVAPDLRGFNESDKPAGVKNYEAPVVAKDIIELIDHLGYEKAIVIGHDWGGAIAWHLAVHYPEQVEKLVVMNCPHPSVFIKTLKSNPKQLMMSWYMFFFQLPVIPELFIGSRLKNQFERAFRGWAYNKEVFDDETIDKYVEAFRKKDALRCSINYYRASLRQVFTEKPKENRSPRVQAPTYIIWGENDKALSKEMAMECGNYVDGPFSVEYIPNCSHWVQNDAHEKVNELLAKYLF